LIVRFMVRHLGDDEHSEHEVVARTSIITSESVSKLHLKLFAFERVLDPKRRPLC
jgi:hypothetical protein